MAFAPSAQWWIEHRRPASSGGFTIDAISAHLAGNVGLIERFLPVEIDW